jgi:hypothetical protein
MSAFVSRAVIALQFEDILQQLIRHSRQRVDETENLLRCIHSNIDKLNPGDITDANAILNILQACQAEVRQNTAGIESQQSRQTGIHEQG